MSLTYLIVEQVPQKETTILTLTFDTDPTCALCGRYVSNFVKLDSSLLFNFSEGIDDIIIQGYPSEDAFSILQIKVVYKLQIIKDTKRYKETLQGLLLGPPLPDAEFEKLKTNHKQLVSKIISFLSWRKGYSIERSYIHDNEVHWHWEVDGFHGNDSHITKVKVTLGDDYTIVPIVPDTISLNDFRDFYSLYKEGKSVPLHHEIFREVRFGFGNIRSGYLILYSALEVATKLLIKYKKPDTEWLMDEMSSPNLQRLYSQYINKEIEPNIADKDDLEKIMNMTTLRNEIAHKGKSPSEDVLSRHYAFVRKFIAKIDVAMGHEWAVEIEKK